MGPDLADPRHLRQARRLLFQHVQGLHAKGLYNGLGGAFPHPFDQAAGKVILQGRKGGGGQGLTGLGPELAAIGLVLRPLARQFHPFPHPGQGHFPDGGHVLAGFIGQLQYGETGILAAINDGLHRTCQLHMPLQTFPNMMLLF